MREIAAKLGGQAALSRRLGVTPTAVGLYLQGKRKPAGIIAEKLVSLGLPPEAFGLTRAAAEDDASPTARARDDASPGAVGRPASREELERALATLSRQVREADEDERATWRDKAQLASSLTSTARALARIAGQEELGEAQILRSRAWRRVVAVLIDSLTLFPEACAAAAEALNKFEAT